MTAVTPKILWVDLETTDIEHWYPWSAVLEVAFVTTDATGNIIAAYSTVFSYPRNFLDYVYENMGEYCLNMHQKSGLTRDLYAKASEPVDQLDEDRPHKRASKEDFMIALRSIAVVHEKSRLVNKVFPEALNLDVHDHKLEMSGATIHFDRRWMAYHLPEIEEGFHYRSGIDISVLRKSVELNRPDLTDGEPKRKGTHRALADIMDAITYYQWARKNFFRMNEEGTHGGSH